MSIIPRARGAGQPRRTPIRRYSPANRPDRTACVTYTDPLGTVALSIRSNRGILAVADSLAWDNGVLSALVSAGVKWLECEIQQTRQVFRASVETMMAYGQIQTRDGAQRVLHLKYWQVDGQPAAPGGHPERQAEPAAATPEQPALFDIVDKMGVYR